MSEEKHVIVKDVMGDSLDVPVKFTESMIQQMQDLYIRNLIRVCSVMKVDKITPNSIKVNDRWTHNPYIDYKDEEMFYKLGKSCIDNGMQWLLITKDGFIHEGVHRILALQELIKKGDYTEKDIELPVLNVTEDKFDKPVEIEFFKFRSNFKKVIRYGMDIRSLWYINFSGANANFMAQSAMLKYVYYEWEQKYKEGFPQPKLIMNYDLLMEKINENTKKKK